MHNCMINSGASNSIMPRCVADHLGMKYEPMIKHVIQLDGTLVTIVGTLKGLKMVLHACPTCTIVIDISIVELPILLDIFLSRDFTSEIGGYITSNWSYMLCIARYRTKTLDHIETYSPSPINMNFTIHDEDEENTIHEHTTPLVEALDYLLDE